MPTQVPFNREECEQWEKEPDQNPRTGRNISSDAPYGVVVSLKRDCTSDWTDDECRMFLQDKTKNPRTQRHIKEHGPTYELLVEACKNVKLLPKQSDMDSHKKKKSKSSPLRSPVIPGCKNEQDPITLEPFAEMSKDERKSLVSIGKDGNKHCMLLSSAYMIYENAIKNNKQPRDPYNPKHVFTDKEVKDILRKMKHKYEKFVAPVYAPFVVPNGIELRFLPDVIGRFYKIAVLMDNDIIYDLGWLPTNIEPDDTGSTDYSTAVVMTNIRELWENGKLFNSYKPGFMQVADEIPLPKSKDFWIYRGHDRIRWNIGNFKTFADGIVDALS